MIDRREFLRNGALVAASFALGSDEPRIDHVKSRSKSTVSALSNGKHSRYKLAGTKAVGKFDFNERGSREFSNSNMVYGNIEVAA